MSHSKSEEKYSHMMVGYGACRENKWRDRYRGRERDHDQSITAFRLPLRAFGEADLGIKWVLIREPKLATMERLAEAALWCLANLSLEGVFHWLGLPGSPQDGGPTAPYHHLARFECRVFLNRTTQELKENKPAKCQGDSQEARRRIREQRNLLIYPIHIQANTDWEMYVLTGFMGWNLFKFLEEITQR